MRASPSPWLLFSVAAVTVTLSMSPSRASTPSAQSKAQQANARHAQELFDKAVPLQEKGKLDLACPMFEESQRLEPNGATMLHLEDCYERLDKTGSAWRLLDELAQIAEKLGGKEQIDEVNRRRDALRPKLLRLTVRIPPDAQLLKNVRVTCDGAELDVAKPEHSLVLDPGDHVVEAHAAGRIPFHRRASLLSSTPHAEVDVTLNEPPPPPPPPSIVGPVFVLTFGIAQLGAGAGILGYGFAKTDDIFKGVGAAVAGASLVPIVIGSVWLAKRRPPTDPKAPPPVSMIPLISDRFLGVGLTGAF